MRGRVLLLICDAQCMQRCRLLERKDTLPSDCICRALLDLQGPSPDGKQGTGMKQHVSIMAIFIAAGVNLVLWQRRHIRKPAACQERACLLQNFCKTHAQAANNCTYLQVGFLW